MSRIGKQPILIPQGVEVHIQDRTVTVKGPKGELSLSFNREVEVVIEKNEIRVLPKKDIRSKHTSAFWGLYRSLINNMVIGVTQGYEKRLEIRGIGYKASVDSNGNLVLNIGFSHPVTIEKPEGINFKVEKNIIVITGIDKQLVGETAARVRKLRPPEPYKGKGIFYSDETIIRKAGKAAA